MPAFVTLDGIQIKPIKGFELCTHAYLVSKNGAEKIMQYSYPIVLPFVSFDMILICYLRSQMLQDHTLLLLARQGILNMYYTDITIFTQDNNTPSMLTDPNAIRRLPTCDPYQDHMGETLAQAKKYDPIVMERIRESPIQTLVSVETRHLKDAAKDHTVEQVEAMRETLMEQLCKSYKSEYCESKGLDVSKNCTFVGRESTAGFSTPEEATMEFVDRMQASNLNGVVIWALTPEVHHSHAFMHMAIHRAVLSALRYSPKRMHVCYVPETSSIDLGRQLYNDPAMGRLAKSLVFASPKHMTWSIDPGLIMLPLESSSRYIFHGETPRPKRY